MRNDVAQRVRVWSRWINTNWRISFWWIFDESNKQNSRQIFALLRIYIHLRLNTTNNTYKAIQIQIHIHTSCSKCICLFGAKIVYILLFFIVGFVNRVIRFGKRQIHTSIGNRHQKKPIYSILHGIRAQYVCAYFVYKQYLHVVNVSTMRRPAIACLSRVCV